MKAIRLGDCYLRGPPRWVDSAFVENSIKFVTSTSWQVVFATEVGEEFAGGSARIPRPHIVKGLSHGLN